MAAVGSWRAVAGLPPALVGGAFRSAPKALWKFRSEAKKTKTYISRPSPSPCPVPTLAQRPVASVGCMVFNESPSPTFTRIYNFTATLCRPCAHQLKPDQAYGTRGVHWGSGIPSIGKKIILLCAEVEMGLLGIFIA